MLKSIGWPMWTREVSLATKRIRRVHCWKSKTKKNENEYGIRVSFAIGFITVLIGDIVDVSLKVLRTTLCFNIRK